MSGVDTYNKIISTVNSVTTDYHFIPDISNIITIDTSNNRIGIGTLNPETSLHIKGSSDSGIITTNLEISSNPYDLNSGFVKSSLIPDNFDYSDPTFTEPSNNNYKNPSNPYSLGDPSNPWHSIYCISGNFHDINLGGNTLYIDGKPILGKQENGNIKFGYSEEDYDIELSAKFTDLSINGNLNFVSNDNTPRIITSQSNIIIDPSGIGDNTGSVTIKGDLIVLGNQTTVSSQNLDISDNIITLNKGYTASSSLSDSGFLIDIGELTNPSLLYNIDRGTWDFSGSMGLKIPSGTLNNPSYDSQTHGVIRFNSDSSLFEGFDGYSWNILGGVISEDKQTKIIVEPTSFSYNNINNLDFYTNSNHVMRLDEHGDLLIGQFNIVDNYTSIKMSNSGIIDLHKLNILHKTDDTKIFSIDISSNSNKTIINSTTGGTTVFNNAVEFKVAPTFPSGGRIFNTIIGYDNNDNPTGEKSFFTNTKIQNLIVEDRLDVTGDTSVNIFDSTGATSLATSGGEVNIASSGQMTTIKGTLNVSEAVTLDSTLDVTGKITVTDGLVISGNIGCTDIYHDTLNTNSFKTRTKEYSFTLPYTNSWVSFATISRNFNTNAWGSCMVEFCVAYSTTGGGGSGGGSYVGNFRYAFDSDGTRTVYIYNIFEVYNQGGYIGFQFNALQPTNGAGGVEVQIKNYRSPDTQSVVVSMKITSMDYFDLT